MSNIEIIIILLLLLMTVPDICRRLGRPALVFPLHFLLGLVLGAVANGNVKTMLHEAGMVGFLLLLFQVGLEIDLPRWKILLPALRFAIPWMLAQYPLVLLISSTMGFSWEISLFSSVALTGVSVGMAFPAWKHYPHLIEVQRQSILHILIVMETITVVLLAVEAPALKTGLSWMMLLHLAGIFFVLLLVATFAAQVTRLFQAILQKTTHWRMHLLVLLVLAICAIGERLGLSAIKTAFFLGLFMSRAEHEGKGLEEFIAPISERFLIPIFFVSLGMRLEWNQVFSMIGLAALGTAIFLLATREVVNRRWLSLGCDRRIYLLLCPNLTVVALGASTLINHQNAAAAAIWLLLTGSLMTVIAIALLPAADMTGKLEDNKVAEAQLPSTSICERTASPPQS